MFLIGFVDEDGGMEIKCGVGIVDVMCGMYVCVLILVVFNYWNVMGEG